MACASSADPSVEPLSATTTSTPPGPVSKRCFRLHDCLGDSGVLVQAGNYHCNTRLVTTFWRVSHCEGGVVLRCCSERAHVDASAGIQRIRFDEKPRSR